MMCPKRSIVFDSKSPIGIIYNSSFEGESVAIFADAAVTGAMKNAHKIAKIKSILSVFVVCFVMLFILVLRCYNNIS